MSFATWRWSGSTIAGTSDAHQASLPSPGGGRATPTAGAPTPQSQSACPPSRAAQAPQGLQPLCDCCTKRPVSGRPASQAKREFARCPDPRTPRRPRHFDATCRTRHSRTCCSRAAATPASRCPCSHGRSGRRTPRAPRAGVAACRQLAGSRRPRTAGAGAAATAEPRP